MKLRNRPFIGQLLMFNAFPRTEFCKEHIYNGAECKVLANGPNTVRVLFRGQTVTDLVSPDYLRIMLTDSEKTAVRRAHDAA